MPVSRSDSPFRCSCARTALRLHNCRGGRNLLPESPSPQQPFRIPPSVFCWEPTPGRLRVGGCGRVGLGSLGDADPPSPPPQLPQGGGRTLPVSRRCGLAFPLLRLVIYHSLPPPPFFSFPLPLFSYAVGAARQPGSAQPPSVLPSLSLIPPFSLKTWAPGCSPLRWQHPSPARAALSPPPPAEPRLCAVSPPIPRPGGAGCGRGERSLLRSCARGDLPQVSSRRGFIANFGLSLLFYRDTERRGRAVLSGCAGGSGRSGGTNPRVGDSPSRRDGRGRWGHPALREGMM